MGLAFSRVFQRLFSKQEMRILMVITAKHSYSVSWLSFLTKEQVGLDAAGKTTILYKLKLGPPEFFLDVPCI